jgi:hypothetical protein
MVTLVLGTSIQDTVIIGTAVGGHTALALAGGGTLGMSSGSGLVSDVTFGASKTWKSVVFRGMLPNLKLARAKLGVWCSIQAASPAANLARFRWPNR